MSDPCLGATPVHAAQVRQKKGPSTERKTHITMSIDIDVDIDIDTHIDSGVTE
jgi:hypothetical protein